jgi:1-acyl-sn-glycerol-3-phosphate acyltransferase
LELEDEQYKPFWRSNKRGEWDRVGKFLFGLVAVPVRTLVLVLCFALFLLLCSLTRVLPFGEGKRRSTCRFFAGALSRVIVFTLGFRITRHNCPSSLPEHHGVPLIASSHVSYMDIMILLCLYQPAFLAKAEIAKAPLVGPAATIMGSIYVERFSHDSKERASSVEIMQKRVTQVGCGHGPVVVFPEGTTTNGQYALLDFKTGIFRLGRPVHMFHVTCGRTVFFPQCFFVIISTGILTSTSTRAMRRSASSGTGCGCAASLCMTFTCTTLGCMNPALLSRRTARCLPGTASSSWRTRRSAWSGACVCTDLTSAQLSFVGQRVGVRAKEGVC